MATNSEPDRIAALGLSAVALKDMPMLLDRIVVLENRLAAVEREREDYKEAYEDGRRNLRRIDVAMHGEAGAALSPSGCDLIGPAEDLRKRVEAAEAALLTLQRQVKAMSEEWIQSAECVRQNKGQRTREKAGYEVLSSCGHDLAALLPGLAEKEPT